MRLLGRKPLPSSPGWVRTGSVAVVLALAASGCTGHPKGSASGPSMSLRVLSGSATLVGGGSTRNVTGESGLGLGYKVQVPPGSLALIQLSAGRSFELASGEALVTGEDRLQLARGSALGVLTAPGQIDTEGTTVKADQATFRVDAGPSSRIGVYAGSATMGVPGTTLTVPAFREAATDAGSLPVSPRPLQLTDGGDVWDHRFLQDAIDLDARLANFRGGLDAQLGNVSGLAFFRLVIPNAAAVAYVAPFFTEPRSDVLIGFIIASDAAATAHADVPPTFNQIMEQWKAGESWGLVAKEYNVSADSVFAGLVEAIRRAGISLASPTPRIPFGPATTPRVTAPSPSPTPATGGLRGPRRAPTPSPTPTPPLNQLTDPVTQLLNDLLNLLLPAPSPQPGTGPTSRQTHGP